MTDGMLVRGILFGNGIFFGMRKLGDVMRIGKQDQAQTAIAMSDADSITVRGLDLCNELIGKIGFTDYFWLLVPGEKSSDAQRQMMDACLVAIAEHGLVPSVQAARMTLAAGPDAKQGAMAAGLLGMGSVVAGSSETAGLYLAEVIAKAATQDTDLDAAAIASLQDLKAKRKKVPGLGHPQHNAGDPRRPSVGNCRRSWPVWPICSGPAHPCRTRAGHYQPPPADQCLGRHSGGDPGCGLAARGDQGRAPAGQRRCVYPELSPRCGRETGRGRRDTARHQPIADLLRDFRIWPVPPSRDCPTYDTVAQAASGYLRLLTPPTNPRVIGPAIAGSVTGQYAAMGIMAALLERAKTGQGRRLDISMLEAMCHFNLDSVTHYYSVGEIMGPLSRRLCHKAIRSNAAMENGSRSTCPRPPTDGHGAVFSHLEEHLKFQVQIEQEGIMFAAGPLWTDDEQPWEIDGMVVVRAGSRAR
ncbi:MAG: hypothetical protein ACI8R4_000497 [Paracoccaceae bacterium]|jgi:hypothetical protein